MSISYEQNEDARGDQQYPDDDNIDYDPLTDGEVLDSEGIPIDFTQSPWNIDISDDVDF